MEKGKKIKFVEIYQNTMIEFIFKENDFDEEKYLENEMKVDD